MRRFNKVLVSFLIVFMILPGTLQATPVVEEQVNVEQANGIKRLAGKNKIETAISISREVYKDGAENIILAGYNGEIDALTGTLLANTKDAPLLLTEKDNLSKTTKTEIKRLNPESIYILGGETVISQEVEIELRKKYTVKRIKGNNRAETAIEVAKEVKEKTNHVFLVGGYDEQLADVLTIGAVSARENIPVLLTKEDEIPKETKQALIDLGVTHITIVGREEAVSLGVEKELYKRYMVNRIEGSNREKTSIAIAKEYFKTPESLLIAYGYKNTDALLGGYLGAKMNAPILLTDRDNLSLETKSYIKDNPIKTFILGGAVVVSDRVFKDIENILQSTEQGPDPGPEPKPETKPEPEPEPEPKPEPEPEQKPESKPEQKPEQGENEDQDAPTGLESLSPTAEDRDDGKIRGVDVSMEYRLKGEEDFISIEGIEVAELTGLKPGIYEVRFKAKEGYNAGTIAEIKISSYFESNFMFEDGVIIQYRGSLSEVIIPSNPTINGEIVRVRSIGERAFKDNENVVTVVLADTVISIGKEAFLNCRFLKSIEISDSLVEIGASAFRSCRSLESITVPDSVITMGDHIFQSCSSLKDVKLGSELEIIPGSTFRDCESLKTIVVPNSVREIKGSAFRGCISLESINIPDSVTNIYDGAFYACTALEYMVIPDSVTDLRGYVFYGCTALKSVKLSNSIKIIGENTFYGCTVLESIVIPNSVEGIQKEAFGKCQALTSIVIPDSITTLGRAVFYECKALESISLSNNIKEIMDKTFYQCRSLKSIIIPDSVKGIKEYAFHACGSLNSITIGKDVNLPKKLFALRRDSFVDIYNNGGKPAGTYIYDNNELWERQE